MIGGGRSGGRVEKVSGRMRRREGEEVSDAEVERRVGVVSGRIGWEMEGDRGGGSKRGGRRVGVMGE